MTFAPDQLRRQRWKFLPRVLATADAEAEMIATDQIGRAHV